MIYFASSGEGVAYGSVLSVLPHLSAHGEGGTTIHRVSVCPFIWCLLFRYGDVLKHMVRLC